MKVKLIILFSLFLSTTLIFAQESPLISESKIRLLDSIATQDVPSNAPGIATGVVLNGEIVYLKYAGYANLKDSVLIDDQSRFNIASNGKQFTALAILRLVEENKLSLEDKLQKFFPQFYPTLKKDLKIKHLLNHSSGIRDVYDLWSLQGITWWKEVLGNQDALALLAKQKELNFEPGTSYYYSNSNYILLAEIIERVSGMSFIEYTQKLFQDLQMPHTSFIEDYQNIKDPIAQPYFNFNTWKSYDWTCNLHGDGNIFSTLPDQLEWEKTLQKGKSSSISKKLLQESQAQLSNTSIQNYGYGLEFSEYKKQPYIFHEGSTGAWKAATVRFPQHKLSIVTLSNSGKTLPMAQTLAMADVLLGLPSQETSFLIEPEKVGDFVSIQEVLGTYETPGGYMMRFVERDGDLYLLRSGRNDMKLVREADNIFQQWNDAPFKQEFTRNEKGEMQISAYYPSVPPFSLTRIESNWENYDFLALNAEYWNEETGVNLQIRFLEDKNYEIKRGTKKLQGLLIRPNELLVNNYRIRFKVSEKGEIQNLFLSSGRIQNLRFTRRKNNK